MNSYRPRRFRLAESGRPGRRIALLVAAVLAISAAVATQAVLPASAATSEVSTASDRLSGSGNGSYRWGNLTVRGTDWNGNSAAVVQSTQWRDVVLGVKGGRWDDQIDFSSANGAGGEKFEILFPSPASNIVLSIGMVGVDEGGKGKDEEGIWRGYGSDGRMVASGTLRPEDSDLGSGVKVPKTKGTFPITLRSSKPIARLELIAVDWDHGKGKPRDGNNTDFGVVSVKWSGSGQPSGTPTTTRPTTTTTERVTTTTAPPATAAPTTAAPVTAAPPTPAPVVVTAATTSTTSSVEQTTTAPPRPRTTQTTTSAVTKPTTAQPTVTVAPNDVPQGDVLSVSGRDLIDGDQLSLSAFDAEGAAAPLNYARGSVGVDAGRYRFQLDFDPTSGKSETIRVELSRPATLAELRLAMLQVDEWKGKPETGRWEAYAADGSSVGSGWLDPAEHGDLRFPLTFSRPAVRIDLTAVAYGRGTGTDRMDNNSDYALGGVTWMAASQGSNPGEPTGGNPTSTTTPATIPATTPASNPPATTGPPSTSPTGGERAVDGFKLPYTDGVTVTAFGADGAEARSQPRRSAIGVSGGRYGYQLDYDPNRGTSEKIRIEFENGASAISIATIMMGDNEWRGLPETGRWRAYDRSGQEIASGILDPTTVTKSKGSYVFALSAGQAAYAIEIEATAYGNGVGTQRLDNNSDFSLRSLRWTEGN